MASNKVMMKLRLVEHAAMKTAVQSFEDAGISRGQPRVLDYLIEHDGCIQREIAACFNFNPASVSSVLSTMERDGYIERRAPKGDRRAQQVFLTPLGREKQQTVQSIHERTDEVCFDGFSAEELELFESMLERVMQNLQHNDEQ